MRPCESSQFCYQLLVSVLRAQLCLYPPWFFRPRLLVSPLQPSWQIEGCIKHVFTLWKASYGSPEYFSSDFLYFYISFDCQFSCTHPSGLSQDVICAAILGCWGCCDGALKENSPAGSAQPAWRCQETKNKRSQDWTVSWLFCVAAREVHSRERNHC